MRIVSWMSVNLICLLILSSTPALAAWSPDPLVTAKTKIALLRATGTQARDIHVDTNDGVVTIHGKVSDKRERRRAEEISRRVGGVKDVRNLLQVVPPPFREMVDVTDAVIQMRVKRALEENARLEGTDVKVNSVNNGVVFLEGEAPTMSNYLRAIEDVASVPGVRGIGSEVKSPDWVAEILASPEEESGDGNHRLSGAAADLWIVAVTKLRLLADPRVPAMDINVDARDGVVTLFGSAPTKEAREAAHEAALKTSGVKGIENEIVVIPKLGRGEIRARDEILAGEVRRVLEVSGALRGSRIQVETAGGVVRLTGTVPSEEHRLLSVIAAHAALGVRAVEEDLLVTGVQARR